MPMKPITRREFLVQNGMAVGFAALSNPLANSDDTDPPSCAVETGKPVYLLTKGGASLYFYFVNLKVRRGQLVPQQPAQQSYIVVQIPPQSLHEQHYESADDKKHQRKAVLSGPSFLSFKLWPKTRKGRMAFDIETLLSWDNQELFALQTSADQGDRWKTIAHGDTAPVTVKSAEIKDQKYDFSYYHTITSRILKSTDGPPLTIFELPAGLLMVPIDPMRKDDGSSSDVVWQAVQNEQLKRGERHAIYHLEYQLPGKVRRRVRERWNVEILVRSKEDGQVRSQEGGKITQGPPALRAVGIIDRILNHLGDPNYLPGFVDEQDIVYLTQMLGEFSKRKYDIGVNSPFRFTQLGASTKFAYKNLDTTGHPTSLVEYEHHFQEGRDNYIKVSRIGVAFPSGLRTIQAGAEAFVSFSKSMR